jgi:glucose/arabinose dehydrogenase
MTASARSQTRPWLTSLVTVALLGATSTVALAQTGTNTTRLQHTVVLDGLDNPWDMAFLPDGTMFYTEKCRGSFRPPALGRGQAAARHDRLHRLRRHMPTICSAKARPA